MKAMCFLVALVDANKIRLTVNLFAQTSLNCMHRRALKMVCINQSTPPDIQERGGWHGLVGNAVGLCVFS